MVSIDPGRLARARRLVHQVTAQQIAAAFLVEQDARDAAAARRARRSSRPGGNPRCRACHRFIAHGAGRCGSCGFDQALGYAA